MTFFSFLKFQVRPCDLVTLHLRPELKMVDEHGFSLTKQGKTRRYNGNDIFVTSKRDYGNNMKEKRNEYVTPGRQAQILRIGEFQHLYVFEHQTLTTNGNQVRILEGRRRKEILILSSLSFHKLLSFIFPSLHFSYSLSIFT